MRRLESLSLMLPLGLAFAAATMPLRLAGAADSAPTAIQHALRVGPGEATPHFFTGDSRLSNFQRLPEAVQHPLQSAAVTAAPDPNAEQHPAQSPRPGLAPIVVTAAATAQVPPPQVSQPEPPHIPPRAAATAAGKPVKWGAQQQPLDAHFFPRHSPIQFASNLEPAASPALANQVAPPAPRLRATEIQPVGTAQIAIAPPPTSSQPPSPVQPERPAPATNAAFASVSTISPVPHFQPTVPPPPPSELTAPATKMVAFESKRLRDPHFFAGTLRLAPLEPQSAHLQAPPLKQALVQPAAALPLPPVKPTETAPSPNIAPQIAALQQPLAPQPTSLLLPSPSRLNPAAVASLPPPIPSLAPVEPQLTSLATGGPEPINPLMPAEVLPAASPPPLREQIHLTALQPLPTPGVNLQPTEVLPIPTPNSPTAPRVPALDAERPISALTTNISDPSGRMPTDLAVERFRGDYPAYLPRGWEDSVYFWDAPSMCIGPLRYEEVNLERYGYSHCPPIQPVLSGMRFLVTTMALPYSLAARPPGTCQYPLGHYRPGSPVPFRHIRPELRPWPAAAECMAVAGLILLIP